jgi:hypothetical protein
MKLDSFRKKATFEQIFGIPVPDSEMVQTYIERVVEAMESKDQELAGLLASRGFEDNRDISLQQWKIPSSKEPTDSAFAISSPWRNLFARKPHQALKGSTEQEQA